MNNNEFKPIKKPEIINITPEEYPEIWEILKNPEDRNQENQKEVKQEDETK